MCVCIYVCACAMHSALEASCTWQAYALAADDSGHNDSFSTEVVRTLLTEVENNRTSVLVILAGYKDKMARLMRADPGLPRRFPQQVTHCLTTCN